MATTVIANNEASYLTPEQLFVGAFVILDLPWFQHSFTLNSFKIRNQEQIQELRALKLPRYRYDPNRSDAVPPQPASAAPPDWDTEAAETAAPDQPSPETDTDTAQATPKQQRQEMLQRRRESVERVEKAFAKATTVIRYMNKNILLRPQETLKEMDLLVGEMVGAFLESPDATLHVMDEKAGGEDVYFHSLNVAILSMMLVKEVALTPEQAREMCIGALLHDIGLIEIPEQVVKKTHAEASKAERSFRASHVERGVAIGKRIGLSEPALSILEEHHEFADASGYPGGLPLEQIWLGARVVALVNFYDNLCNPSDISKALTPHEALSYMYTNCRAKFDSRILQKLIRSLGVHPPGSIVQLSNECFAIVTTVNPKKPLRPWILIYDEGVPKEEAIVVNLESEPDLQILKSLRPSLLPPKVAAYLNPRKRVTYFFDGGSSDPNGTAT